MPRTIAIMAVTLETRRSTSVLFAVNNPTFRALMRSRRQLTAQCLFLALIAALGCDAHAELRVVALTGQPAPGTIGFTISSLSVPALNAAGHTAFQGTNNASSTI